MWSTWTGSGLEHLYIIQSTEQVITDSLIVGVKEQEPFRVRYEIQCDQQWQVCTVQVSVLNSPAQTLSLVTDGKGAWCTETREELPLLQVCLDVTLTRFRRVARGWS